MQRHHFVCALAAWLLTLSAWAGEAVLSWGPPTQNTDGSPLTDLAGYRVYYGQDPTALNQTIDLPNPSLAAYVVENLAEGAWHFSITAYNAQGVESARSNQASKTVEGEPLLAPGPPVDLTVTWSDAPTTPPEEPDVTVLFIAAGPVTSDSNNPQDVTYPAGIEEGDIAILWHVVTGSVTDPTGFDLHASFSPALGFIGTGGTGIAHMYAWRRCDGTEDSTTISIDSQGSVARRSQILVYRGAVATGTPVEGTATAGEIAVDDQVDAPNVTTTGPNRLVVQLAARRDPDDLPATPSGWTQDDTTQVASTDLRRLSKAVASASTESGPLLDYNDGSAAGWVATGFAIIPETTGGSNEENVTAGTWAVWSGQSLFDNLQELLDTATWAVWSGQDLTETDDSNEDIGAATWAVWSGQALYEDLDEVISAATWATWSGQDVSDAEEFLITESTWSAWTGQAYFENVDDQIATAVWARWAGQTYILSADGSEEVLAGIVGNDWLGNGGVSGPYVGWRSVYWWRNP